MHSAHTKMRSTHPARRQEEETVNGAQTSAAQTRAAVPSVPAVSAPELGQWGTQGDGHHIIRLEQWGTQGDGQRDGKQDDGPGSGLWLLEQVHGAGSAESHDAPSHNASAQKASAALGVPPRASLRVGSGPDGERGAGQHGERERNLEKGGWVRKDSAYAHGRAPVGGGAVDGAGCRGSVVGAGCLGAGLGAAGVEGEDAWWPTEDAWWPTEFVGPTGLVVLVSEAATPERVRAWLWHERQQFVNASKLQYVTSTRGVGVASAWRPCAFLRVPLLRVAEKARF
jgi:hypothetical protein